MDGELAAALHRLGRVEDQVHEQVVELLDIGPDRRQVPVEGLHDLDVVKQGLVLQQEQGAGQGLVDVLGLDLLAGLAGEFQQFLHGVTAALGIAENPLQVRLGGLGQTVLLHHQAGEERDAAQRVVELVGHPGSQLSQRGHLLGLHQLKLGAFQFVFDPQPFAQVVEKSDGGHLAPLLVDEGGVEADGNGLAVLAQDVHVVPFEFSAAPVAIGPQVAHDLASHLFPVTGVDLPDVQGVQGFGHRVAGDLRRRFVEDDDLAAHVGGDDRVHGAVQDVAQKHVAALKVLLQAGEPGDVVVDHGHRVDAITGENRKTGVLLGG